MLNFNKKKPVKSFVIASRGTTMYEPAVSTHINSATGVPVLAVNQVGFFAENGTLANKSLKSTDTTVVAPRLAVYQGVDSTINYGGPLRKIMYEKTQPIDFNNSVRITKQPYQKGQLNVWAIQNFTASPLAAYSFKISFRGHQAQRLGSPEEALHITPQFITPAYTTAQLATTAPVTEIINNLAIEVDSNCFALGIGNYRQGTYPVLALAIDTAAGSGVALSTLTAGTVLSVMSDSMYTKTIVLNQEMADSIKAGATAAGIALTSTIVIANKTTPVTANALLLVGLDRVKAVKDYEWKVKTRLEVGLASGFNLSTTTCRAVNFTKEVQGGAPSLANDYLFTQGQRKYNLLDVTDPVVNYPNIFTDMSETYNVFVIEHEDKYAVDSVNTFTSMLYDYICVETPTKGVESVAGLFTTIETRLNTLLSSANLPPVE